MDGALKELDKLEKLTAFTSKATVSTGKGKTTVPVAESLDGLLLSLRDLKERLEAGVASEEDVASVSKIIEERKKEIDERMKETHSSLVRVGKALDKVRPATGFLSSSFNTKYSEIPKLDAFYTSFILFLDIPGGFATHDCIALLEDGTA